MIIEKHKLVYIVAYTIKGYQLLIWVKEESIMDEDGKCNARYSKVGIFKSFITISLVGDFS